ncbi:acyl-CoA thioesterase [Spongiibacter marinus]|uniref:acyl-CoA thioesterase n=1 Tax=Spongiibacter marinus TaxID=354246 RepID=UPI0003FF68D1|nr:thioesterase family protein [Spongiibacter marinus]
MSAFDQLMAAVRGSDGVYTANVEESWLQGRTAFGGLSSALIAQAMRSEIEPARRLRSLAVSFVGPAPAGNHQVVLRHLRDGGSVTHIQGELRCEGEVATAINATYGKDRQSAVAVEGPVMPESIPAPQDCMLLPFIDGLTPAFTQHFDMALASGHLPLSGGDSADFSLWLRFRDTTALSESALIALADAPPMPGLNMIKPPGVGSSLSWYLEFPNAVNAGDAADNWWFMDYRSQAGSNGYFCNYATIWSPSGVPIMFSRQVATVFEK